jgi:hypothetical protein
MVNGKYIKYMVFAPYSLTYIALLSQHPQTVPVLPLLYFIKEKTKTFLFV